MELRITDEIIILTYNILSGLKVVGFSSINSHSAFRTVLRAIGRGGLLLATTIAVAGSSFAQSGPQTTGTTIASNSSAAGDADPNANAAATKPSPRSAKPGESTASANEAAKDAAQNPVPGELTRSQGLMQCYTEVKQQFATGVARASRYGVTQPLQLVLSQD